MASPTPIRPASTGQSIYSAYRGEWTNLYVIGPLGGPFKIGQARNASGRLIELQTGNPLKLFLEHTQPVPVPDAFIAETYAHALLRPHAMTGEWFKVRLDTARAAADRAVADMSKGIVPLALIPAPPKARRAEDGLANLFRRGKISDVSRITAIRYRMLYERRAMAEAGGKLCSRASVTRGWSLEPLDALDELAHYERAAAAIGATTGILMLRRVAGEGHMIEAMTGQDRATGRKRLERLLVECLSAVAEARERMRA